MSSEQKIAPPDRLRTVERITATTVVVDGDRYGLDRLERSTSTYGPTRKLRNPNAPEVAAIARRTAAARATDRVESALENWRKAGFSVEDAAQVRDALAALAPYISTGEEKDRIVRLEAEVVRLNAELRKPAF